MSKLSFKYLNYNDDENILLNTITNYISEKTIIITQDSISKKFFSSSVNQKKLKIFQNIFSIDDLWEKIFFSDKNILGDIKAFFAFYFSLDTEIKNKLNIKNYYDSIEYASEFFEFFKYIKNKDNLKNLNLSKWQIEKFEIFFDIKETFDIFLNKNNYILENWLYEIENLDLSFLNSYDRVIFYDVLLFPKDFNLILQNILKKVDVEIVLQMSKGDFNERNLKLENISLPKSKRNYFFTEYKNDFELHNIILKKSKEIEKYQVYSPNAEYKDTYLSFAASKKTIFNNTKLYRIMEVYIEILDNYKNKYIDLFQLKNSIFKSSFMEFYGLDIEDYNSFIKILENDYRYISLDILINGTYDFYFKDNKNLYIKLKEILENIELILNIRSIEELNNFFKTKFFYNDENIKFFIENKYSSIYDKFYEILGILNSNENNSFFDGFSNFFEKNVGRNIFVLFFNYLNNLILYTETKNIEDDKFYLKDLYDAKYMENNLNKSILVGVDNLSLPKSKKRFNIFTEQQKSKLGINTGDYEILIEKYRTFQNLLTLKNLSIYSLVDIENNIEVSSFILEFINEYSAIKEIERVNFLDNLIENENLKPKGVKYRAFKKEKEDFKNSTLKIGAYDYISILNNETFFFLDKICSINSQREIEEVNGISSKILGIILHRSMEEIFKNKWKDILHSTENLLMTEDFVEKIIKKNFKSENLKIENFLTIYQEKLIIPRFVKNILRFLRFLYEELKDKKILRIEAEKTGNREIPFLVENSIQVYLIGRADLIIETDKEKYIFDLKTGSSYDKKQLKFYTVMFFDTTKERVKTLFYNFWKDIEIDKTEFVIFEYQDFEKEKAEIEKNLRNFLNSEFYELPSKSKLVKNDFDFKQYYNYKNLCCLDMIEKCKEEE